MPNTVSISEKPWSDYTGADYSIEQWHNACLIHQHDGSPTSKSQCKLPVKTPNGTLNRNGVHAAAAALAGARGGVNASPEEKASAIKQIRGAYSKLGEKPPPSMMQSENVQDFLAHWGIKGMRWGIRRSDAQLARANGSASDDALRAKETLTSITKSGSLSSASDSDLNHLVNRINLEKRYTEITKPASSSSSAAKKGGTAINTLLKAGDTMNKAYTFANSPAGRILASGLGLIKAGPGQHAAIPNTVIDLPTTKIGKHRA